MEGRSTPRDPLEGAINTLRTLPLNAIYRLSKQRISSSSGAGGGGDATVSTTHITGSDEEGNNKKKGVSDAAATAAAAAAARSSPSPSDHLLFFSPERSQSGSGLMGLTATAAAAATGPTPSPTAPTRFPRVSSADRSGSSGSGSLGTAPATLSVRIQGITTDDERSPLSRDTCQPRYHHGGMAGNASAVSAGPKPVTLIEVSRVDTPSASGGGGGRVVGHPSSAQPSSSTFSPSPPASSSATRAAVAAAASSALHSLSSLAEVHRRLFDSPSSSSSSSSQSPSSSSVSPPPSPALNNSADFFVACASAVALVPPPLTPSPSSTSPHHHHHHQLYMFNDSYDGVPGADGEAMRHEQSDDTGEVVEMSMLSSLVDAADAVLAVDTHDGDGEHHHHRHQQWEAEECDLENSPAPSSVASAAENDASFSSDTSSAAAAVVPRAVREEIVREDHEYGEDAERVRSVAVFVESSNNDDGDGVDDHGDDHTSSSPHVTAVAPAIAIVAAEQCPPRSPDHHNGRHCQKDGNTTTISGHGDFYRECVLNTYGDRLTARERENDDILDFLQFSEDRRARLALAVGLRQEETPPTNGEGGEEEQQQTRKLGGLAYPSPATASHCSSSRAASMVAAAYRRDPRAQLRKRDALFPQPTATSTNTAVHHAGSERGKGRGSGSGSSSHHLLFASPPPPAVFVAPPVTAAASNGQGCTSHTGGDIYLTPFSPPSRFVRWICDEVDVFEGLLLQ